MWQFFKALILFPVAIVVVLLAVANRGPVTLSFDPFSRGAPEVSVTVPLFALLFLAVMAGMVIGGVASWLAQSKHRRARRIYRREAERLRAEAERLRANASGAAALPALPAPGGSRL
jgi:uncharacterized integral membrane protein